MVDFSGNAPIYDFAVRADKVNLCQLNLTDFPCEVSFVSDINFSGSDFKSMVGEALISNVVLRHDTAMLTFDKMFLTSQKEGEEMLLSVLSDFFELEIEGNFNIIKLPDLIQKQLFSNLKEHNETWKIKVPEGSDNEQSARFALDIKDVAPLLSFLNINGGIGQGSFMSGGLRNDLTLVDVQAIITSVSYGDIMADTLVIDMVSQENSSAIAIHINDL